MILTEMDLPYFCFKESHLKLHAMTFHSFWLACTSCHLGTQRDMFPFDRDTFSMYYNTVMMFNLKSVCQFYSFSS